MGGMINNNCIYIYVYIFLFVCYYVQFAERVLAKPNTKEYGIPSIVFQLYCSPVLNFKIPPTVFFPKPKVDSALMTLDFNKPLHPTLVYEVNPAHLRNNRSEHEDQGVDYGKEITLSEYWEMKRPEQLSPLEFIRLTKELYGMNTTVNRGVEDIQKFWNDRVIANSEASKCRESYYTPPAWRSSTSAGGRTVHKVDKGALGEEEELD